MSTQLISIQVSTVDEALHLQNLATINIGKYQSNPVKGQEHKQNNLVHLWIDIHTQAGLALNKLLNEAEVS